MKIRRISAAAATVAAGALVLSACQTPGDDEGDAGIDQSTAVTVGWNQSYYEYNDDSATGNATANANINYMLNAGFNYYDADLNLVQDTSFGSYEKISDDPLTVEYTINDDQQWSDGTPVTAADLVMYWGAVSGNFNTEEFETDAEGTPIDENGDPVPEDVLANNVFFNATVDTVGLIEEMPETSEDGQTVTFTYTEAFADW